MKAVVVTMLALFVLLPGARATADEGVEARDDWFDVSAETQEMGTKQPGSEATASVAPSRSETSPTAAYSHQLACGDSNQNLATDEFACDSTLIRCGTNDQGLLYYQTATFTDGSEQVSGPLCLLPQDFEATTAAAETAPAPPRVTPGAVLRAFRRVPLPDSELVIQPPGGQTLVGLGTIFSTEAEGFTEELRLLGRRVELAIEPSSYTWVNGDGTSQTTDWPGRRWQRGLPMSSYVSHVYEEPVRVVTRVDTTWSARFRVGDGPWQEVPGTVTIEGEESPLRVRSASPRLVGVSDH
jgi:hypothetical protein